ncbi:S9 family peptidase [Actinorugispora endophytica]|uniref:Dipeptidyl aminopeptidase/acylaminoacyl peptidase n=1 Tax=Actinorugispora endophytica TaxID=1605990 RepID=A0A4R6V751_9ACTN|nr:prolyl oligopeptidase family serine peptidase [Actinorugispora endophytica]TDQ52101.1 dipeptidyl aminopeptidase/acylaminoacyl peptidase [Actinorugispora endophytica]
MTERVTLPYGSWPSPVAAADIARGTSRLGFPSVVGDEIWWEESRPDEDGRNTVMHRAADGTVTDLLPPPWNARTRVHEYGGRAFLPVPRRDDKALTRWGIVFSDLTDQRLHLLEKGAREPRPLTPEPASPAALRYADPVLSPDQKHVVCVRESHEGGSPVRAIVSVPLSGRAAEDPSAVRELVTGSDFFASPVPSPDGTKLAWISWNHPRMPWVGTELRVGDLDGSGPVTAPYTLRGGPKESVLAPLWRDSRTLYFVSDWAGWWNLYEIGTRGPAMALFPEEAEFTPAPWQLGTTPFRVLDDGRMVVLYGNADLGPGVYDPATAELVPLKSPLTSWQTLACDGTSVVGIAASPTEPASLVRLDPDTGATTTLRRSPGRLPDTALLPVPVEETLPGRYGGTVHAFVYPPTSPDAVGEGPAPYVVWAHGGPTTAAGSALDLEKAYFTSRGIGVVEVNYGGSTGYGRSYRERLDGQWGVVDVEDAVAAARALVDRGVADPARLAIRGGSAGGTTTLLALTGDTFACGASYYGVTDLLRLAEETHDFESRYLDTLVGPLPGYASTYRERSPVHRAAEIDVPVLLLQGADDPVVPPAQARKLVAVLRERGVPHAHVEFPGESHGFRGAAAVTTALETELAFYCKVFFGFTPPGVPPVELTGELRHSY